MLATGKIHEHEGAEAPWMSDSKVKIAREWGTDMLENTVFCKIVANFCTGGVFWPSNLSFDVPRTFYSIQNFAGNQIKLNDSTYLM